VNRRGGTDEEAARITREIAERAIRRLDVLEWVILAGAVLFAVIGGWVVAVLLGTAAGLPFTPVWIVASLLLFGAPGAFALRRTRREERERLRSRESEDTDV
jgi:uncharacterized membrane protein